MARILKKFVLKVDILIQMQKIFYKNCIFLPDIEVHCRATWLATWGQYEDKISQQTNKLQNVANVHLLLQGVRHISHR